MKISIYSCNEKMAAFMRGEMTCLDVRDLPDPSPTCQDLFGTDPRVWDAMVAEDSRLVTGRAITAVSWALVHKTLCVFCEGGWQRSVAIAEKAPKGSIVCKRSTPYGALFVGINSRETLIEDLPLSVLRWGEYQYPDSFTAPKLPTLADMTVQEREECMFMQAVDRGGKLCIILYVSPSGASVLYKGGANGSWSLDSVTPRPDLPRLEWPSCEPEPEYRIGKILETLEDFKNAPIGTVARDADGDIMCKKDECSWAITDELGVVNTDEVHLWYTRPAKIIAVLEEQK